MKKPDSKTNTPTSAKPGEAEKKPAAKSAAVKSTPVKAGDAAKAAASGGEVKPVDSALLGDKKKPDAAAEKKPAASSPAPSSDTTAPTPLASPQSDRLASVDKEQGKTAASDKPAATDSKTTAAKPTPAAPAEKPRSGFWPMALGGAVAAGLGAAATMMVMQPAPAVDTAALKQEILAEVQAGNSALRDEAVAAAKAELATDIETMSQQAGEAGAEAARQIIADMPTGADTTPELQAALEAQGQQITALSDQLAALPTDAPAANDGVSQQELMAIRDQIQQAAADAQAQLDAVKAEAEQMQQAAESSTQRAEAVAAIAALQSALDEGVSTEPALQQLQDAGVAAPEAVTQEVPTLAALQEQFPPAARAALRAALRDSSTQADGGTRIGNFLRAQTGARSVQPREGGDPDAVLSRADAAIQGGDVAAALTEVSALPEVAQQAPEMADWMAGAQAYIDARAALNDLSGQSN